MNILALDLGTKCGWSLHLRGGAISGGSVNCAPGGVPGQRWLTFRNHLTEMKRAAGEIHVVYFEDVRRHPPGQVLAAHCYGGFRAHLETWCALNNIRMVPVGVGEIKKHWTGKGNADKAMMIAEARARKFVPVDDNHADALAILALALDTEGLVRKEAA